jgi:hypothetical protein
MSVSSHFVASFIITLLATAALLGGIGFGVTRIAIPPSRDVFRAPAFEFELAHGWWCEFEEGAYVCTPPEKPPHAAIVVMAMKQRGNEDNLEAYEKVLQQTKQPYGKDQISEIRYVRRIMIGNTSG